MAEHKYDAKTRKAIKQFTDADGKRRTIRLSDVSKTKAGTFYAHLDKLVEARRLGEKIPGDTLNFLKNLNDRLHKKLVKLKLLEPREVPVTEPEPVEQRVLLGEFLDDYITKRTDVKPATRTFYGHTRRNLVEYFGDKKPVFEITEGDADDFRRYLIGELPAEASVNRRCGMAKTFFRSAVRHRLIPSNPFQDLDASIKGNASKQRFIDRATIDRIIEFAPDAEWRLLIVLARYGGLRIPSEALSLRWCDIDWEKQRIRVTAPKTEHHENRGTRDIPIFPELVQPLQEAWDQAEEGDEFVISRHRPQSVINAAGNWHGVNFRTQFTKIIRRAGFEPWPRIWQNLRSSRETELASDHPLHVVCAWIGNTERIAARHYLQVTDAHFEKALHKALQYEAESGGTESESPPLSQSIDVTNYASSNKKSDLTPIRETAFMGDAGIEPATSTV
jgi:integrase